MWIQEEPELADWETRPELVEELLIGDTEYEVYRHLLCYFILLADFV